MVRFNFILSKENKSKIINYSESCRRSQTAVLACVAPSWADTAQTLNTLRYCGPIKAGLAGVARVEPDPRSPASWDNARLQDWVTRQGRGRIGRQGRTQLITSE